ncbi:MAG: DUF4397 domain-containing protein [Cytophagaceae bacterium]|nr:DUF4397 domain-containing protein [Cytophagaceae bacterium]
MIRFFKYTFLLATATALVTACGDKNDFLQSVSPATGARVKFFHAAPDAPGLALYLNDKAFSGANTVPPAFPASLAYGLSFPLVDYGLVAPGTAKVKVNVAATATTPEVPGFGGDLAVEDGKYYSVFATGVAPTYEVLVVNDKLEAADRTKAYIRIVNLVTNSPVGGYELTVNGKSVTIAAAYKTVTEFQPIDAIPFATTAVPVTVKAGTTTALTLIGGLQPYANRYYTMWCAAWWATPKLRWQRRCLRIAELGINLKSHSNGLWSGFLG